MNSHHNSPTELPPSQNIRLARSNDRPNVVKILADAFRHDPVMRWMNDNPSTYTTLFDAEARALYMKKGRVFVNRSNTGAALWAPPGVSSASPWHWSTIAVLWRLAITGGWQSVRRGIALETTFKQYHPKEPHYYLFSIGAVQGQQGQGIGSALLAAGVKECDQHAMPAWLESSNPKNNLLYERFGFQVQQEIQLPENGPSVWLMKRPVMS